jgi:hypothetical protein
MEDFTLAVIRHGNNHAAPWFTKREAYYKVHTDTCDLNCDPDLATCTKSITQQVTSLADHINSRRVA